MERRHAFSEPALPPRPPRRGARGAAPAPRPAPEPQGAGQGRRGAVGAPPAHELPADPDEAAAVRAPVAILGRGLEANVVDDLAIESGGGVASRRGVEAI